MKENKDPHKIRRSVTFDPDLLERIPRVKGRLSRSKYICIALDEIITRDENKLGIVQ